MSDLERKLERMRQSRERMDALIEAFRKAELEALAARAEWALERTAEMESYSVDEFRQALARWTGEPES